MSIEAPLLPQLSEVRSQLAAAADAAGRSTDSVTLLAVSKQHPAEAIRMLAGAGQRDFGESYVQEALGKIQALQDLDLNWHYIGQLQGNKTRSVAEHFHWVHTLDRNRIAVRLNEQRPPLAPPLQVCIQIKLAEEATKGGVWPEEAGELAQQISRLPRLKLRGLMCIPPAASEYAEQLAQFKRMRDLLQQLNNQGFALDTLSMGMSGDYAAAIAAGSTLVRIGTAIFGTRQY
ncbi:MAG: YggS family pyridoxal phosphate-dependent enzyme [Steroidobacteraceae bacterium]